MRPVRPELDACGIGFVADAQGRSSRAIVDAALNGLACVKHRGAIAADARTADGSGVLVPIPAGIFGDPHGLSVELGRHVADKTAERIASDLERFLELFPPAIA